MVLIQKETRSANSHPRLRPSWSQEWDNIQFLSGLNRQLQSLRKDELDYFESDVAVVSGVAETALDNDLLRVFLLFAKVGHEISLEKETYIRNDPEEELARFRKRSPNVRFDSKISEEVEESLDWDAHIEAPPPPRRSGTVKVRFKYIGRSKPIPIDDPWA